MRRGYSIGDDVIIKSTCVFFERTRASVSEAPQEDERPYSAAESVDWRYPPSPPGAAQSEIRQTAVRTASLSDRLGKCPQSERRRLWLANSPTPTLRCHVPSVGHTGSTRAVNLGRS
jgi:hypothetical protein